MIPRHFAINLAVFQGLLVIGFAVLYFNGIDATLTQSVGGSESDPSAARWFLYSVSISLLSASLAGLMTSPYTRVTLLLASLQLIGGVGLLQFAKISVIPVASALVILVAAASLALTIYRRREQLRLRESPSPSAESPARSALSPIAITLGTLHLVVGLPLLAIVLTIASRNDPRRLLEISPFSQPLLLYYLIPFLLSLVIATLLLTRHTSLAWSLSISQLVLSSPCAILSGATLSPIGLPGLIVFAIALPSALLLPLINQATPPPDLTAPLDHQHAATLRAQREREAATWESPSVWTSRYLGFQVSAYTIACAQILLSIIIIFLWYHLDNETTRTAYRDRDYHLGPEGAWLTLFLLTGALTLATGCAMLSPWARVTIGLAGLQAALALGFLPLGAQFHTIPAFIVPLSLLSLGIALWRRRVSPPEIAT